jgi:hypothetical protein
MRQTRPLSRKAIVLARHAGLSKARAPLNLWENGRKTNEACARVTRQRKRRPVPAVSFGPYAVRAEGRVFESRRPDQNLFDA